jgi:hypothetical protein
MEIHCNIPVINGYVKEEFLYDMDEKYTGHYKSCKIYAVSSYKDHTLTFKILLNDGGLFDYIPLHALVTNPLSSQEQSLTLKDLTFGKFCPDYPITVNVFAILKEAPKPYCFFYKKNLWIRAKEYVCSVDWYTDNENANIVILENEQIALVPNHKILFTEERPTQLPAYKKLHAIWKK